MIDHTIFKAALFLSLLGAPSLQASQLQSFVGYASCLDTGELVYTEVHNESVRRDGAVELTTTYFAPDGQTIAVRKVDFSASLMAPDFDFTDVRTGYGEGVRRAGDDVLAYRKDGQTEAVDEEVLERPASLVADAGFDRLVTESWDQLIAGKRVTRRFVVPGRLQTVKIQLQMVDERTLNGQPAAVFRMRFTNPLLRLLAGSIDVTYHREDRFLLRYEGLSNVSDLSGDYHNVRIDFPVSERVLHNVESPS